MITAQFSNGFSDTYKGTRAIKAAWMITRKSDGKVLASGHSLDAAKAQKTAEGNLTYLASELGVEDRKLDMPARGFGVQEYMIREARKLGFAGKPGFYAGFARRHNADRKAKILARANIETIDL